jgi:hypothetical protein
MCWMLVGASSRTLHRLACTSPLGCCLKQQQQQQQAHLGSAPADAPAAFIPVCQWQADRQRHLLQDGSSSSSSSWCATSCSSLPGFVTRQRATRSWCCLALPASAVDAAVTDAAGSRGAACSWPGFYVNSAASRQWQHHSGIRRVMTGILPVLDQAVLRKV